MLSFWTSRKFCGLVKVNSLTKDKILDWSNLEIAYRKMNCSSIVRFVLNTMKALQNGRRKCFLSAPSPFPTISSKEIFFHMAGTTNIW